MSNFPPPMLPGTSPGLPMTPTPPKKQWWKRKAWKVPVWGWIAAVVIGLTAAGAAAGPKTQEKDASTQVSVPAVTDSTSSATAVSTTEVPTASAPPADTTPPIASPVTVALTPVTAPPAPVTVAPAPETAPPVPVTAPPAPETAPPAAAPDLTPSQQNAVRSAQSYLNFTHFSRLGLIDQLSSEYGSQFPIEDATLAVDSLNEDWDAQAVGSAQDYLKFMAFSCQGLIDQLSSEYGSQFTVEQATHGATQAGLC